MSRSFRTIKPRFWLLLLAVILVTCTAVYTSQQRYITRQVEMIAELEAERTRLIEENAALQHKIDFTYTDEYIEREARSKLGLIKDGEILFESND